MNYYLGVDVGSLTVKFVLLDEKENVLFSLYERTAGNPISAIQKALKKLNDFFEEKKIEKKIAGLGTTGSARYLASAILGADLIKNEITAHAQGVLPFLPDVKTIIEIGGQDSKIIILEEGRVVDFAMNLLCSAGTGAFLDAQSYRLGIDVRNFGEIALKSKNPTAIASRCSVFAESDMIHKQQVGHLIEDIVAGLCLGLARNFLSTLGKGKNIQEPIAFLGGVSENLGMRWAFEKLLGKKIIVPSYNTVTGALGVALLTKRKNLSKTKFRGFDISDMKVECSSFVCKGCSNECEVISAQIEGKIVGRWGDRCGKWSNLTQA
ncbi:MAG: acyl-CoA dehydratase activase [Minisyncoccales bacterium]